MRARDQRGPFGRRDRAVDSPTQQGISTTVHQPQPGRILVGDRDRRQHHVFVIAHQVNDLIRRHRRLIDQPVDHLGAVGTAIHVISQMNQRCPLRGPSGDVLGDHLVQGNQPIQAAMYVANGVNPLTGWQGGGGCCEFNHADTT